MNNNYYAKLAKNKSLLKEYKTSECDRSVYLEDGDEFQFQLFNPETTEICARIFIEDTQLSHDIVLRPGERLWLERYTDISKKFKFVTYVVDGENAQVKKAISHNGIIKIEFFRRKEKKHNPLIWVNSPSITWTYDSTTPYYYNYTSSTASKPIDSIDCSSISSANASRSLESDEVSTAFYSSADMCSISGDISCDCSVSASASISTPEYSSAIYNPEFYKDTNNLETGRISEGGRSNQKLDNVNMDFESWPFRTETLKIYPLSRKPYNAKDLKKIYCTNCGRRLNDKYKYCPYCGEKID